MMPPRKNKHAARHAKRPRRGYVAALAALHAPPPFDIRDYKGMLGPHKEPPK